MSSIDGGGQLVQVKHRSDLLVSCPTWDTAIVHDMSSGSSKTGGQLPKFEFREDDVSSSADTRSITRSSNRPSTCCGSGIGEHLEQVSIVDVLIDAERGSTSTACFDH